MVDLTPILHKITALSDIPEPYILKQLIDNLRVSASMAKHQPNLASERIQELNNLLKKHPDYAHGLAAFILTLLNKYHRMSLFTDTGILSDQSFSNCLTQLIAHRFIPLLPEEDSIIELVAYLFDGKHDERWLASIDTTLWDELIDLINVDKLHIDLVATAKNNLLNAMVILSYRISGIGLHPELMRAYPQMLDYSAAFVAQNQEAVLFANEYREAHKLDEHKDVMPSHDIDPAPLMVMIDQCEDIVSTIRKRIYKTGISIRMTNMLLRLEQSLKRMRILTELLADNHHNRDKAVIELTQAIILSVKRRYSIGHLINNNTKLLSRKVTENSGRVGEHYISTDKSGYYKMFKKAAIGGFVIAFMATTKILTYDLDLAPMGRAFVNSMIYGLGFVLIHIIHGTVATKQPAMTAAAIASTISDSSGKKSHQLAKLSEIMVDIVRTQFIAIMGNVLVAMPLALIISIAWLQINGVPMISDSKAEHLMHDLDPIDSLALFHAAIAGVYLFLAGLIAGFYDNLAVFNNIGQRIARHKLLLTILPLNGAKRLGAFVEANLGAIMGNFIFGVFLGSTATFGYLFGLPLDIRHIAFSSANFAHGLFNLSTEDITLSLVFVSLLGVMLIGVINLLVSFTLAILVALRSKSVRFYEWKNLGKLVFTHLVTQPRDFFLPRHEPMHYARLDREGDIIHDTSKKTEKQPTNTKYFAVRRLSEVKVLPDSVAIDKNKIDDFNERKNFNEQVNNTKPASKSKCDEQSSVDKSHTVVLTPTQEEVDANLEVVNSNELDSTDSTLENVDHPNLKQSDKTKNAKTPLPKPKVPPKLPD